MTNLKNKIVKGFSVTGLLFSAFGSCTYGQSAKVWSDIDSLKTSILNLEDDDTLKGQKFLALGEIWASYSLDSLFQYTEHARLLAVDNLKRKQSAVEKRAWRQIAAQAYHNLAYVFDKQGQVEKAEEYYSKCGEFQEQIGDLLGKSKLLGSLAALKLKQSDLSAAFVLANRMTDVCYEIDDKECLAEGLNLKGLIRKRQGLLDEALEFYHASLKILRKSDNKKGMASAMNNMAVVYSNMQDIQKAESLYNQALAIYLEIDFKAGIADEYSNLASLYRKKGEFEKALELQRKVYNLRKQYGNHRFSAIALRDIGDVYYAMNGTDSALVYYQQALEMLTRSKTYKDMARTMVKIGHIKLQLKELNQADRIAKESHALAVKLNSPSLLWHTSRLNNLVSIEMGNWQRAHEMLALKNQIKDTLNSEKHKKAAIHSQYRFEYEKQALTDSLSYSMKEAVLVERTEKQQLGLAASIATILLVSGLAYSIRRGKKRSDELLLNILPEETAKELKAKGHADAKLIDQVTVLFTDFKGFTQLSETLGPKELVAEINECFSAFDNIITKHGIEKIKTIGDAYMAAGGLPVPNRTNPENVIAAALEIRDFIRERNSQGSGHGFEVRIGVHTGPVVAGIVGIKKFQYDIWGDTVNTASRMESSGEVDKVNISESTYRLLKGHTSFRFESRGKIEAKGKGELEMFFVETTI